MDTINIKYAKTIFVLSLVSVVAFFVSKTLASLSLENGWIIGPHMAFAERLKSGILAYCNGVDDIFFPSSPYFPGAAFLSYFYSLVGLDSGLANTTALLLTSIAIGIALFIAMYCFIRRIYPQIPPVLVFAFLSIFSFLQVRSFYSAGILWFKSDGILLLCGFLSMLLFTKHSKPTLKNLILIGILLFIASFLSNLLALFFF